MPLNVTSPHILQVGGTAYDLRHVISVAAMNAYSVQVFFRSAGRQIAEILPTLEFEAAYQASLDASLASGGGGGIAGVGSAGRVTIWSGSSTVTSDADLTYANDTLGVKYQRFSPTAATPAYAEGTVFYDQQERALSYYNEVDGVTVNLGQETLLRVYNDSGSIIQNGLVVYVNGAQGQRPTIRLARADAKATSEIIGVSTHDIGLNAFGYVTVFGLVHDVDTAAFIVGQLVYLSATVAGAFTATIPPAPARTVKVGIVTQAHPTHGHILVHPDVAPSLNDLNDVWYPTALADRQAIAYNAAALRWENRHLGEADIRPLSKTCTYDGFGRLATMTDSSGTKTMAYDGAGRLASVTASGAYQWTKTFSYDGTGALTGITVS